MFVVQRVIIKIDIYIIFEWKKEGNILQLSKHFLIPIFHVVNVISINRPDVSFRFFIIFRNVKISTMIFPLFLSKTRSVIHR